MSVLDEAHYDGDEYAWHPDGADAPPLFVAAWLVAVGAVLAGVGWLIL